MTKIFGPAGQIGKGSYVIETPSSGAAIGKILGIVSGSGNNWTLGLVDDATGGGGGISANSPLSIAANVLSIQVANGSQNGYLSASDWSYFAAKQTALGYTPDAITAVTSPLIRTGNTYSIQVANTSQGGYLTATDWNTFNSKQAALGFTPDAVTSATAPIIRTGNIYSIPVATNSVNGYLSSTDWTTFNGKQNALGFTPDAITSATAPIIRTGNVYSIPVATASVNGYLSSTDWTTFNGKQNALGYTAANDGNVIHTTGNEAKTGNLTLTGILTCTLQGLFTQNITAGYGPVGEASCFSGSSTILRLLRTGLADIGLGEINGDSFCVRNNGDSSTMFAVHTTTKTVTTYGGSWSSYKPYVSSLNSSGYPEVQLMQGLSSGYGGTLKLSDGLSATPTGFLRFRYDGGYPKIESTDSLTISSSTQAVTLTTNSTAITVNGRVAATWNTNSVASSLVLKAGTGHTYHTSFTNSADAIVASISPNGAIVAASFNGVALSNAGSAGLFLNQAGGYTAPAGGGGGNNYLAVALGGP